MRLSKKIFLPIVILLIALISVSAIGFYTLYNQHTALNNRLTESERLNENIHELEVLQRSIEIAVLSYGFELRPTSLGTIEGYETRINEVIQAIRSGSESMAAMELIERVVTTRQNLPTINNELLAAVRSGNRASMERSFIKWTTKVEAIDAAVNDLSSFNLSTLERSAAELDTFVQQIFLVLLAMCGSAVIMSLLLSLYFHKKITQPIQHLSEAAAKIANKQFDININVISDDEIGLLAAVFKDMAQHVKSSYIHLETEIEKKDEFISIASHELKTPLTSLKIYIQMLRDMIRKNNHSEYEQYFKKINAQSDKLNNLVSNLLDIARIEGGKISYNKESFDLNELVREVAEDVGTTSHDHTIRILGYIDEPVYGDQDRIAQVLTNLLSNAIKYSPGKEEVIVELLTDGAMAKVSIKDLGLGIDEKYHSKLFERFFRVEDDGHTTFPGMGVGLYISEQIIRQHNGKIWLESKKDMGSTFYFTIPLA